MLDKINRENREKLFTKIPRKKIVTGLLAMIFHLDILLVFCFLNVNLSEIIYTIYYILITTSHNVLIDMDLSLLFVSPTFYFHHTKSLIFLALHLTHMTWTHTVTQ